MSEQYLSKEDLILDVSSKKPESGVVKIPVVNEAERVYRDDEVTKKICREGDKIDSALDKIGKEIKELENKGEKENNARDKADGVEKVKEETSQKEHGNAGADNIEMNKEQREKNKKIHEVLKSRGDKNKKEALSLGDKAYLMMINAGEAYKRIPPKYRKVFLVSASVGSAVLVLLGLLDNDSNEQIHTVAESLTESLEGVDAETVPMSDISVDPSNENVVHHGFPESPDISESPVDSAVPQGFPESPDVQNNSLNFNVSGDVGETWGGIEETLDGQGLMEGYGDKQRLYVIDTIKDDLAKLSPEELIDKGFSSGNINIVYPGETIDLSSVIEAAVEENPDLLSHPLDNSIVSAEIPAGDTSVSNSSPSIMENPDPVADAMFGETDGQIGVSADAILLENKEGVPVPPEGIELGVDMNTNIADSTTSFVEDTYGNQESIPQGADIVREAPGTEETISAPHDSAPHDSIPESALERLNIDQAGAEQFFESREMPSYFQDYSGLFSGEDYLNNWIDPNSGVATCEINDFLSIDVDKLSGEIGVESKDFVQKVQELIKTLKDDYGNVIPKAGEQKTVFDWLQSPLGSFVK